MARSEMASAKRPTTPASSPFMAAVTLALPDTAILWLSALRTPRRNCCSDGREKTSRNSSSTDTSACTLAPASIETESGPVTLRIRLGLPSPCVKASDQASSIPSPSFPPTRMASASPTPSPFTCARKSANRGSPRRSVSSAAGTRSTGACAR